MEIRFMIFTPLVAALGLACATGQNSAAPPASTAEVIVMETLLSGTAEGAIAVFGKPSETKNQNDMIYVNPVKLKSLDADRMVLAFWQNDTERQSRLWLSMAGDHGWKSVLKALGYEASQFVPSEPVKQNMSSKGFDSYSIIHLKRDGKTDATYATGKKRDGKVSSVFTTHKILKK